MQDETVATIIRCYAQWLALIEGDSIDYIESQMSHTLLSKTEAHFVTIYVVAIDYQPGYIGELVAFAQGGEIESIVQSFDGNQSVIVERGELTIADRLVYTATSGVQLVDGLFYVTDWSTIWTEEKL